MENLNELFSRICSASEWGKKITVDLQTISQIRDEFWLIKKIAEAAEAELKRLSEREPAGYQKLNCKDGSWCECSKDWYEDSRGYHREFDKGAHLAPVRALYAEQPPVAAVLPPEVTEPAGLDHRESIAWINGANWMREKTKALGAQPEKAVYVPSFSGYKPHIVMELQAAFMQALDAAGIKWEQKR